MDKMIEVRYAGAVVGRSAIVRELDTQGLFLGITEPMPVGTIVTLKIGDQAVLAKVAGVAESQELARAGMRVRFADPASAALFGTPAQSTEPAVPFEVPPTRPSAPQAVPREPSRSAPSGQAAAPTNDQLSGPRRIVVDASTEGAVASEPEAAPPAETAAPAPAPGNEQGEGGNRKNRRNKRR